MPRRQTKQVRLTDSLGVGSDHPLLVQSMTNTATQDIKKSAEQVKALYLAGSKVVRLTVKDEAGAKAIPEIDKLLKAEGFNIPLVGDFHYNGHLLLAEFKECAETLVKYRINPGNVGYGEKHDYNFDTIIKIAKANNKAIRIGVNWGSIDQDLLTEFMDLNSKGKLSSKYQSLLEKDSNARLASFEKAELTDSSMSISKNERNAAVGTFQKDELDFKKVVYLVMRESAIRSCELAMRAGMPEDKIILSVKMSEVPDLINIYRMVSKSCDFPLHLGLTEAGTPIKGMISSSAALGILLSEGIGDTIRMSLTPGVGGEDDPLSDRTLEVKACQELIQALELDFFKPSVTSCPGCGRTSSTYFQKLAEEINHYIQDEINDWRPKYPGVEKLKVAVMGCIVNGPGESKYADIGISLPGDNEDPSAPVYIDGKLYQTLRGENISSEFRELLQSYIQDRFKAKV